MNKTLIACNILFALGKTQDNNKLYDLKIAVTGEWKGHANGPFKLTLEDLEQIKTNFENMGIDIVADFEHASLWDNKAPATGWIKELFIKGEELWAKVKWLDDALELIQSEKYKYISPVLDQRTIDQVTGDDIGWSLHSVALTNRPFFEELGEVIANKKNHNKEKIDMDPKDKKKMDDLEAENKDLKKDKEANEAKRVEGEVDAAIAAKKVHPDQKADLLAFGKTNKEGLTNFLDKAKKIVEKPEGDMFVNNKQGGEQLDVLKLGGIDNG
ncbi:phage protease [Sulfurimonas sp.]|uniref:phage protease n=1 Tax=Sulfurimonas sp. TaxID=2022749 RepID=UPI0025E3AAD8|nr:phage protease [Sulfurimonas sp.]